MNELTLNTSPDWKKTLCLVVLFFYFSAIAIVIDSNIINDIYNIAIILLVFIMIPELIREAKKFKGDLKSLLFIPIGIAMMIVIDGFGWDIVYKAITSSLGITVENANNDKVMGMIEKAPVLMIFLSCVHGPILEELLYRYTAFGLIRQKSRALAYIITPILFAIQHVVQAGIWGGDYIQLIHMPDYIISGLIYAFLYEKTKNLWVPISVHILCNAIGVYMMLHS